MIAATVAAAVPAHAADDSGEVLNALVRARLAEESAAPAAALSALATVSSAAPGLPGIRGRMLEQAIEAGDFDAARSAAQSLWTAGDRRFDAQLVLMVDAMRRSDWDAARTYMAGRTDKTGADTIARLITPTVNAWIDIGARDKFPEQHLLAVNSPTRPEPALSLQVALVQIAAKRADSAASLTDSITLTDRTSQLVGMRVAATLDKAGKATRRCGCAGGSRWPRGNAKTRCCCCPISRFRRRARAWRNGSAYWPTALPGRQTAARSCRCCSRARPIG